MRSDRGDACDVCGREREESNVDVCLLSLFSPSLFLYLSPSPSLSLCDLHDHVHHSNRDAYFYLHLCFVLRPSQSDDVFSIVLSLVLHDCHRGVFWCGE